MITRLLSTLVVLALPITVACSKTQTKTEPKGPAVQELTILAAYQDGVSGDLFAKPKPTFHDVLERVWEARDDDRVKGLLLHVGPMQGAWGRVRDLSEAINGFRESKRPVACHFESADNVAFLLMASVCDHVSMTPAGTLDLVGPASMMLYAADFLTKVGVKADILHMGRYKGAGDMFIRNTMPPEAKQSMDAILDDLAAALQQAVASRTKQDPSGAQGIIDRGPFVSSAALDAKLVDSVGFLNHARTKIKSEAGVEKIERVKMMPSADELTVRDFLSMLSKDKKTKDAHGRRMALVYLTGNIVEQPQASPGKAASGPFIKAMDRLAKDDDVRAVVLRINSPGGSALASDRMWHAVRELAKNKPVIASVADMAASGGYYIASAADTIFAHPNSLVGSIGVVGGKMSIGQLADKLGVNAVVLSRGTRAAWATPVRPLTPGEREGFHAMLKDTYNRFIERVSEGRKMPKEKVLAAAEGRVMTGQDGQADGLIDTMGGLSAALKQAKKAGSLDDDAKVEIWPPRQGVLDAVSDMLGGGEDSDTETLLRVLGASGLPLHKLEEAQLLATYEMLVGAEHQALLPAMFVSFR